METYRDKLERLFRTAYKAALGVVPAFDVDYLSDGELVARTERWATSGRAGA